MLNLVALSQFILTNMPAQMASGKELKRVSKFINRYGQVQEGNIYQNLGGNAMERTPISNRLAEETSRAEEKKEE